MQIYVIRITDKGGREHGAGLMSGSALPNVSAWVMDMLLLGLIRPHEYDSMTLHRKRTYRRRVVKWFFSLLPERFIAAGRWKWNSCCGRSSRGLESENYENYLPNNGRKKFRISPWKEEKLLKLFAEARAKFAFQLKSLCPRASIIKRQSFHLHNHIRVYSPIHNICTS